MSRPDRAARRSGDPRRRAAQPAPQDTRTRTRAVIALVAGAAAVLLLDQAMIESARAVESDPTLAELDQAVHEVHVAGHSGDPGRWESALGAALTACRASLR